jgi:hypothetical protein
MDGEPGVRPSALRGIWGGVAVALFVMWMGAAPAETFPPNSDVVTDFFRWFFSTFRFWPGLAILAGLGYTVARRVDHGDQIKEDLNLVLTVLGLILSGAALFFSLR